MIHLPSIFRRAQYTVMNCKHMIPDVVYSFTPTIGRHIFNFKETVVSYDHSVPLQDQYECCCKSYSSYIEGSCGHVATGNLSLISNSQLQDLFKKGPGHRKPQSINIDSLYKSLSKNLKEFIRKWSKKENMADQLFDEWFSVVMLHIRERLDNISVSYKLPKYTYVFDNHESSECLKSLKKNFVLVPVDKASKNIAIICKHYYMEVLLAEMLTNSSTYEMMDTDSGVLFGVHQTFLTSQNLVPPCDMIPYIPTGFLNSINLFYHNVSLYLMVIVLLNPLLTNFHWHLVLL